MTPLVRAILSTVLDLTAVAALTALAVWVWLPGVLVVGAVTALAASRRLTS